MVRETYEAQVALLVRILPHVAKEEYLRSKAARRSTCSTVICRACRLILISPTCQSKTAMKALWSCPANVPVSQLIYAAFRSNAKGLLPPSDEWRRRGL